MSLPIWEGAVSIDGSTTSGSSTGTLVSRSEEQIPKLLGLRYCWIQSASIHSMGRVIT